MPKDSLKVYVADEYTVCNNCGYTVRRGWKINDDTSQGLICGRCCEECGLEPTARVVMDTDD